MPYQSGLADRKRAKIEEAAFDLRHMNHNFRLDCSSLEDVNEFAAAGEFDEDGCEPYEQISDIEIVKQVLIDTTTQMNALFRFCVGVVYGLPEVCADFEMRAAYDYIPNRDGYDLAWRSCIPDAFQRKAGGLYEHACEARLRGR